MKRVVEICVGSADKIFEGMTPQNKSKVLSFSFGKTAALLHASEKLGFIDAVDKYTDRKEQDGLTVGQYLFMLINGRSEGFHSRNKIADWFSTSSLRFIFTPAHQLSAQNCINNMRKVSDDTVVRNIEMAIAKRLVELGYSPTKLIFDTSNFYTYIEHGEKLPKKGHSKHHRFDKNIVNLALAITDTNMPFLSESRPGNEHEADYFVKIFDTMCKRLETLKLDPHDITLVFDKGINSDINIGHVVDKMHILGSIPRSMAGKYFMAPLNEFEDMYENSNKNLIKGKRFDNEILYGGMYTVIVSYNESTYTRQKKTYEKYKIKILNKVEELQKKATKIGRGRKLTQKGAINALVTAIPPQYRGIFDYSVPGNNKSFQIKCSVITKAEEELYLSFGKNVIFTDNHGWPSKQIIQGYNSKSKIEDDFKWLNDSVLIPMKPFFVRKDISIRAHVFLCVMGLVLYRFILAELGIRNVTPATLSEKLDRIKLAFVKNEEKKTEIVVEDMPTDVATIFAKLRLDRFVPN